MTIRTNVISTIGILVVAATTSHHHAAEAFSAAIFQESATLRKTTPSKTEGLDVELPDFDEFFDRVQQVSPLARAVIEGAADGDKKGFACIDKSWEAFKWKNVESNQKRLVHQVDKIDNFQGNPAPLLRFRSSMEGTCIGSYFAKFITQLEERKKWDAQIEQVYPILPIHDIDAVNMAMGFGRKYGTCQELGVGYCQTKANLGIDSREQLTLCGINDFHDGSAIIWGVEMADWHNHLLPAGKRHTRAKTNLFSTTLTPTGKNTFDVEYVLQLEIGGNLPTWLTTPIVVENVKKLFKTAEAEFGQEQGMDDFLKTFALGENFARVHHLLMTPC